MRTSLSWNVLANIVRCAVIASALSWTHHATAQERYELGQGDKLKVTVFGYSDVSGEATVGSEDTISLALVGSISVKGKTAAELEKGLVNSFSETLGRPVSVRVELLEHRPFYVIGAVNSPGSYPYRPGIAVLQALAIAGGPESVLKSNAYMFVEGAREEITRDTLLAELKRALSQHARLVAERDHLDRAVTPPQLTELAGKQGAAALMVEANTMLQEQNAKTKQKLASFEEIASLSKEELGAYQAQLEQLARKESVIQSELDSLKGLEARRLISRVRVFDLERTLPEINAQKSSVMASIARAKQEIFAARNSSEEFQLNRQLEIDEQIATLEQNLEKMRSKVRGSALISSAIGGDALRFVEGAAQARYEIIRKVGGKLVTTPANELTPVRAGDVIRVMVDIKNRSD